MTSRLFCITLTLTVLAVIGCRPGIEANRAKNLNKPQAVTEANKARNPNRPKVETTGFEEVTGAKDGAHVTLTDWIDQKYLCLDVTETQRDICTTALNRSVSPPQNMEIKLWVCSEERRTNCIVFEPNPENNIDMRKVFVYDNDGDAIDFDGMRLIAPNHWYADPVRLKLTGKVRVIDGQGRFVEPIEKIEAE